ncbi:MAG: DUF2797 domain-containing protein [Candidatus Binatia bacterium]
METLHGDLRKMIAAVETPVAYALPLAEERLPLNPLLGQRIRIAYQGQIQCRGCGQLIKKSFNEGFCYRCFSTLAQCDICIVKPELCHFAKGTCREPEWGQANCMQPHYVYLANASGLKVGITRHGQIPTRWIDQGAAQALPVFRVPSRHQAGLVEVAMKKHVSDRTDWRKMLKGEPEMYDLKERREELLVRCQDDLSAVPADPEGDAHTPLDQEEVRTFAYPVLTYPSKVIAFNLDKVPTIEGTLLGIKGQYLIFDTGVLNVRKFSGYQVAVSV